MLHFFYNFFLLSLVARYYFNKLRYNLKFFLLLLNNDGGHNYCRTRGLLEVSNLAEYLVTNFGDQLSRLQEFEFQFENNKATPEKMLSIDSG